MADYTKTITEFKNLERNIIDDLKVFKDSMNVNTVKIETNLKKSLDNFNNIVDKTLEDYKNPKIKNELPEKEYNRRVNEIQTFKQSYIKLNGDFDSLVSNKYGYVRLKFIN
jgi:hypothetical protein